MLQDEIVDVDFVVYPLGSKIISKVRPSEFRDRLVPCRHLNNLSSSAVLKQRVLTSVAGSGVCMLVSTLHC